MILAVWKVFSRRFPSVFECHVAIRYLAIIPMRLDSCVIFAHDHDSRCEMKITLISFLSPLFYVSPIYDRPWEGLARFMPCRRLGYQQHSRALGMRSHQNFGCPLLWPAVPSSLIVFLAARLCEYEMRHVWTVLLDAFPFFGPLPFLLSASTSLVTWSFVHLFSSYLVTSSCPCRSWWDSCVMFRVSWIDWNAVFIDRISPHFKYGCQSG